MTILVTEDDEHKWAEIRDFLVSIGVHEDRIRWASNMAQFMDKFDDSVTICIIDLRIPVYDNGPSDINGLGVLQAAESKGAGRVRLLAISSFPDEFERLRSEFEGRGCMLVSFEDKGIWQSALRTMVAQSASSESQDFIIFCALRSERSPYSGMPSLKGRIDREANHLRLNVEIGNKRGCIIELPRMGLVDAAATVASCIQRYRPTVVAMSGVCAGVQGRTALGQLLISEMAYEYQSGKWTKDSFSPEPYQVPQRAQVRTLIREMVEDDSLLVQLEKDWTSTRPAEMNQPKQATFTSGSAVIAQSALMEQVASYHRRVSGLDMEVYAVHRAAEIAHPAPDVICAKVVVDLADGDKNDALQPYGAYVSARFIVKALSAYFG